ncbi:MAG: GAF domain-containing protein [Planctomycetota bacterium]
MALHARPEFKDSWADELLRRADAIAALPTLDERLEAAVQALWDVLGDDDPSEDRPAISWIGFYRIAEEGNEQGAEPGNAMLLGPHRPKPACSPIGMHGACGQAFLKRETMIVDDVEDLGEGYVACDPRDRSELIIPMFDDAGNPWGVLDADSFATKAFSEADDQVISRYAVACRVSGVSADKPTRSRA